MSIKENILKMSRTNPYNVLATLLSHTRLNFIEGVFINDEDTINEIFYESPYSAVEFFRLGYSDSDFFGTDDYGRVTFWDKEDLRNLIEDNLDEIVDEVEHNDDLREDLFWNVS